MHSSFNTFFVFQIMRNNKFCAFMRTIHNSDNLATIVRSMPDLYALNAHPTKRGAEAEAQRLNQQFRKNHTYMYAT